MPRTQHEPERHEQERLGRVSTCDAELDPSGATSTRRAPRSRTAPAPARWRRPRRTRSERKLEQQEDEVLPGGRVAETGADAPRPAGVVRLRSVGVLDLHARERADQAPLEPREPAPGVHRPDEDRDADQRDRGAEADRDRRHQEREPRDSERQRQQQIRDAPVGDRVEDVAGEPFDAPRLRGAHERVDTDNRTLGMCGSWPCVRRPRSRRSPRRPRHAQTPRGELDFRRVLTGAYIEGSVSFLRVRDARGELVVDESAARRLRWRVGRRLPPGRYRLTSFERPCDGNCSLLDPPTERCSRRIKIIAHGRTGVRATVRPGRGCRLRVRARPALFPPPERVQAARRFLSRRAGIVSWALIDSHGRMHALAARRTFISASLVKAMLLVAYLRHAGNRVPTADERALLGPMITRSDNRLATPSSRVWGTPACARSPPGPGCGASPSAATGPAHISARRTRRASSASSTCSCPSARARTRAGCSPRSSPGSAGASPASRSRPASTPSSRAAGAARASAGSSTRRPSSSAGPCACRWRC